MFEMLHSLRLSLEKNVMQNEYTVHQNFSLINSIQNIKCTEILVSNTKPFLTVSAKTLLPTITKL
jgi:hypothetical protein